MRTGRRLAALAIASNGGVMNGNRIPTYVLVAVVVAGILVIAGVPLATLLPLALLLVCPLMMLVMMRGMGHGGDRSEHQPRQDRAGDDRADRPAR
jgi:hypothetical protein